MAGGSSLQMDTEMDELNLCTGLCCCSVDGIQLQSGEFVYLKIKFIFVNNISFLCVWLLSYMVVIYRTRTLLSKYLN